MCGLNEANPLFLVMLDSFTSVFGSLLCKFLLF